MGSRTLLNNDCGSSTYQDLLSPTKPTVQEVVTLVQEPLTTNSILHHTAIHFQYPSALHCTTLNDCSTRQCGATLEEMLRDRLVCGRRDKHLQYKLLADPTLTFERLWPWPGPARQPFVALRISLAAPWITFAPTEDISHRPSQPSPPKLPILLLNPLRIYSKSKPWDKS